MINYCNLSTVHSDLSIAGYLQLYYSLFPKKLRNQEINKYTNHLKQITIHWLKLVLSVHEVKKKVNKTLQRRIEFLRKTKLLENGEIMEISGR